MYGPRSLVEAKHLETEVRYVSQSLVFIDFPYQDACHSLSCSDLACRALKKAGSNDDSSNPVLIGQHGENA